MKKGGCNSIITGREIILKLLSFDLSSAVIGVLAAEVNPVLREIKTMRSCPIIPPHYDATHCGYLKSKKKVTSPSGKPLNAYLKPGEMTITKQEKEKRDKEVRHQKDLFLLGSISKHIHHLVSSIQPELILVEKNAAFNGILTSMLLAKTMGTLLGVAGPLGIPVKEYPVNTVRKSLPMNDLLRDFVEQKSSSELKQIPDVTKRAIRVYLTKIYGQYGAVFHSDDESDACAVFHHWWQELKEGGETGIN